MSPTEVPPSADLASPSASADRPWSWPHLIGFRVAVLAGFLFAFPFPVGVIPGTESLAEWLNKPLAWALALGAALVGAQPPPELVTGSGDTSNAWAMLLVFLALAVIGTAVWTAIDRRRRAHPRLAALALIGLRYYLGSTLISYGLAKLSQFPAPGPMRLDEQVGELSPMGMLWAFMGSSTPYSLFAGIVEVLGGVLLLWRRTAVLGALLGAAAMTNVFVLNLTYDVPVKLFSFVLLAMAVVIALPQARRLMTAVLGGAVGPAPEPPPPSPRRRRVELAIKCVMLALFAYAFHAEVSDSLDRRYAARPALYGRWIVDHHLAGGVEVPATVPSRWVTLSVDLYASARRTIDGVRVRMGTTYDEAARTVTFEVPATGQPPSSLTLGYTLGVADGRRTLVLDGTAATGAVHLELHEAPPPLLTTRGFHLVSERPFNR